MQTGHLAKNIYNASTLLDSPVSMKVEAFLLKLKPMKVLFEILMFCSMFAAFIFGLNLLLHPSPTTTTLFFISVISFLYFAFFIDKQ